MIRIIPAAERRFNDFGWLKTYWLFSFDTYYDPNNLEFGALRVFNDDVVMPGTGFPMHRHAEMEIITIVLSGAVSHADSLGNKTTIRAGEVQRMTAGTGITHSEHNEGSEPVHFYQIWIRPDQRGLTPGYEQKPAAVDFPRNRLHPVASNEPHNGAVHLKATATIYLASFDDGQTVALPNVDKGRLFIYVTDGQAVLGDHRLQAGDQARIERESSLRLEAQDRSQLILIAVP